MSDDFMPFYASISDQDTRQLVSSLLPDLLAKRSVLAVAQRTKNGGLERRWELEIFQPVELRAERVMCMKFDGVVSPALTGAALTAWLCIEYPEYFRT